MNENISVIYFAQIAVFLRPRLSHSVTRAIVFIYVLRYIDLLHAVLLTMVDTPHCPLL